MHRLDPQTIPCKCWNVVNGFFIFGVFVQDQCRSFSFQAMLKYLLLPLCLCYFGSIVACAAISMSLSNAGTEKKNSWVDWAGSTFFILTPLVFSIDRLAPEAPLPGSPIPALSRKWSPAATQKTV
jgi:hypothetical protein